MKTLTSANSIFAISIPGVLSSPVVLEGYSTDDAFSNEAIPVGEAVMGVDGFLSGGYVPQPTKVTVNLQADSPSRAVFDLWLATQQQAREVFICNATVDLPGTQESFTLTKGFLTLTKQMPDAKKTLQATSYEITFQSVQANAQRFF